MSVIGRILGLAIVTVVGAALYYGSRFWDFRLWERPGLFGSEALPPQGRVVRTWLRGTDFAVFELLIWVIAVFLILTAVQWIFDRIAGLFGRKAP